MNFHFAHFNYNWVFLRYREAYLPEVYDWRIGEGCLMRGINNYALGVL